MLLGVGSQRTRDVVRFTGSAGFVAALASRRRSWRARTIPTSRSTATESTTSWAAPRVRSPPAERALMQPALQRDCSGPRRSAATSTFAVRAAPAADSRHICRDEITATASTCHSPRRPGTRRRSPEPRRPFRQAGCPERSERVSVEPYATRTTATTSQSISASCGPKRDRRTNHRRSHRTRRDHGVDRGLVVLGDPQRFKVGNVGALRSGAGKELVRMVNVQSNLMLLATALSAARYRWSLSSGRRRGNEPVRS